MACYDLTFIGLLFFTLLLNLPYFFNLVFYSHDSLSYYATFYTTYNNFFYHGEFVQWLPYSSYGVHANFIQITQLTVVDYFVILAGGLLKIPETLFLFKVSLLLEQIIFLFGMYLLSKKLFKEKTAVFFTCACALGSLVLCNQLFWGFLAFYLLPLVIYCLQLYFRRYDLRYLLIAMNISLLAMAGSVPYYEVITLLVVAIIVLFLIITHRHRWKELLNAAKEVSASHLILFLVFLALASAYGYLCFCRGEHITILSPQRDPTTYTIPLDTFLSYGGDLGFEKFMGLIQPRALHTWWALDLILYMGFLMLLFVGYGVMKVRDPTFYSFVAVVVVLVFFSVGGMVSRILYHIFPGMHYYRHIALSVTCFKIFLPLMAGFGVDAFLKNSRTKVFSFGAGVVVACLLVEAFIYCVYSRGFLGERCAQLYIYFVLGVILIFPLMLKRSSAKQFFKMIMISGICVELLGYQAILASSQRLIAESWPKELSRTCDHLFQATRTIYPPQGMAKEAFDGLFNIASHASTPRYAHYYNMLQWDPEAPYFRIDFINTHVLRLLEARGVDAYSFPFILLPDPPLQRALGGETSSKLQLISNVFFVNDEKEAIEYVKTIDNIDEVIVLNNVPLGIRIPWVNYRAAEGNVFVTDFSSNSLSLIAALPVGTKAWLYYADGFHPSWKAFVNGQPTPIFQANVGFKAILLEGGIHDVRFVYDNKPVFFSFCIFIIAGFVFVWTCLMNIWKLCILPSQENRRSC